MGNISRDMTEFSIHSFIYPFNTVIFDLGVK